MKQFSIHLSSPHCSLSSSLPGMIMLLSRFCGSQLLGIQNICGFLKKLFWKLCQCWGSGAGNAKLFKWNTWQLSMAQCDGRWTRGKRHQALGAEGTPAISESVRQRSSALIVEGWLAAAGAEHLSFMRSSPHTDLSGRENLETTWRGEQTRSRNTCLSYLAESEMTDEHSQKTRRLVIGVCGQIAPHWEISGKKPRRVIPPSHWPSMHLCEVIHKPRESCMSREGLRC